MFAECGDGFKVLAFANGAPCSIAGQYVKTFNFNSYNGRGFGTFTDDPKKAKQFADEAEAMVFWSTVSGKYPMRADGQLNRPLTSATCELEIIGPSFRSLGLRQKRRKKHD